MRQGKVYLNGIYAGLLSEVPGEGYSFVYDDVYYSNPQLPPISLTLPKKQKRFASPILFPFFSNMLSEGYNRKLQAVLHHLDQEDDFGFLLATADCDTPGAVTIKKSEL